MKIHVPMLLKEAIWRCCNGHEAKAVPGMSGPVPMLLTEAIWRCYRGHVFTMTQAVHHDGQLKKIVTHKKPCVCIGDFALQKKKENKFCFRK